MIENLVVVGTGKVYYTGVNPVVMGMSIVGEVIYVDPAMFETASTLVHFFCQDVTNPASPKVDNKMKCMGALRQLFTPTGASLLESKEAVEMVFALWAARGSLWRSTDQATLVR